MRDRSVVCIGLRVIWEFGLSIFGLSCATHQSSCMQTFLQVFRVLSPCRSNEHPNDGTKAMLLWEKKHVQKSLHLLFCSVWFSFLENYVCWEENSFLCEHGGTYSGKENSFKQQSPCVSQVCVVAPAVPSFSRVWKAAKLTFAPPSLNLWSNHTHAYRSKHPKLAEVSCWAGSNSWSRYRWVALNPNKQYWVKILQFRCFLNQVCRITQQGWRCGFERILWIKAKAYSDKACPPVAAFIVQQNSGFPSCIVPSNSPFSW